MDGAVQCYRDSSGPLREWEIRLDQLDDAELAAIEQFFAANQGCFGNFSWVDPWNGQTYANCSFANPDLSLVSLAEMKGRTTFVVKENRA